MQDISKLKLGESDARLKLESSEDNRAAALALASQARLTLDIFTPDLEKPLYDTPEFLQAVKQLAIRHARTRIRILVQDATHAVKNGHRLIYLAQRLSSKITLRTPSAEYKPQRQCFLIADGIGLMRRIDAERYEGALNFKAPMEAKEYEKFFDEVWLHSEIDPYLRRLHI
ncbi:MAG: hypothetical protein AB1810_13015 [Pseudomonadota bacterium]